MRIPAQACLILFAAAGIVSVVMWRELRTERQVSADLRTQLAEARASLAAMPPAQAVAEAMPLLSADVSAAGAAPPAATPANTSRETAAAVVAEYAKKAKTLLDDPEYRKAHLAQVRVNLQQRYANLAVELGISVNEADALFDLLAENQIRLEARSAELMVDGVVPDAAAQAEAMRVMASLQKQQETALVAMLGSDRFDQLKEYELTQPSRTRVTNLTNLLARSGQPLSNAQTRSLTAAMVTEQKRMEAESMALRESGQIIQQTQADRQVETNRRILAGASGYLDARQIELLRGRFEERATIDRASDRVQQREREVLQGSPQ